MVKRQDKPKGADGFARLSAASLRRAIFAQPASRSDILSLHGMLRERIDGEIADAEAACLTQAVNPLSIWSFHGRRGLVGGIALLPLNAIGLYWLIYGKLDLTAPPGVAIATPIDTPAVIYAWAIVARGCGIAGLGDVRRQLETPLWAGVDVWARPATDCGAKLIEKLGFERIPHGEQPFYKLHRSGF